MQRLDRPAHRAAQRGRGQHLHLRALRGELLHALREEATSAPRPGAAEPAGASFFGWTFDAFDFFVLTFMPVPLSVLDAVPGSAPTQREMQRAPRPERRPMCSVPLDLRPPRQACFFETM